MADLTDRRQALNKTDTATISFSASAMARGGKRKPAACYSPADMKAAVAEAREYVRNKRVVPWVKICRAHNEIPRSSLFGQVMGRGRVGKRVAYKGTGPPTLLPKWGEEKLATWVRDSVALYLTPTVISFANMAARVAASASVKFNSGQGGPPNAKWIRKFCRRHKLSLRKTAPLSHDRRAAMTDVATLVKWHSKYQEVLDMPCRTTDDGEEQTFRQCADRIANGDESGWQRMHKCSKGVMPTGIPTAYRPGTEDKESISQFAWGTALGIVLDPFYILKGKQAPFNILANCKYYKKSAFIMKQETHVMDGE